MIDKDGVVKLRKPSPWSTREIARTIDKTPLRRDEVRDRAGGAARGPAQLHAMPAVTAKYA